jgi:hypothetical protein
MDRSALDRSDNMPVYPHIGSGDADTLLRAAARVPAWRRHRLAHPDSVPSWLCA